MLPLLPLLLLFFRDAGGSHKTLAQTPLSAAIDGLAADKDPQRSHGDAAAAISLEPGDQDMVAVHMLRLYEKYSRKGARPRGGNTVRSFRARLGKWELLWDLGKAWEVGGWCFGALVFLLPLSHLFILPIPHVCMSFLH